jgi:hypothetical protein
MDRAAAIAVERVQATRRLSYELVGAALPESSAVVCNGRIGDGLNRSEHDLSARIEQGSWGTRRFGSMCYGNKAAILDLA